MVDKDLKQAEKTVEEGVKGLTRGAQGFQEEFLEFLKKYQVIGLAIAFVIGAAASKLVTAAVQDVVMPIIAVLMPQGDWRTSIFQIGPIKFLLGDFVGAVIDFLIIALVVFLTVKYVMKGDTSKKI
ncbi:MAG: MscL family protein [Methanoregulaceae archaeon]